VFADSPQLAQLSLHQATQLQTLVLLGSWDKPQESTSQLYDLSPIAGLTNLTHLGYVDEFCLGITALTTLTALTQLSMIVSQSAVVAEQYAKPTTQSALAAALSALASLKKLSLSYVQAGPVTDTLPQLTSLAQLKIAQLSGISWATPLLLPISLAVLELPWLDMTGVHGIRAPGLQHVTVKARVRPGQEAELQQLTAVLLQHCADLSLLVEKGASEQDMVGLMAVLRAAWTPTSVARTSYSDDLCSLHGISVSLAWGLTIWDAPCTQCVLQQVPPGITNLELKWVSYPFAW
jgi:hypothetical protein